MATVQEPSYTQGKPANITFRQHLSRTIEDFVDEINWLHVAFKVCAYTYIAFIAWITWQVIPVPGHWDTGHQPDRIPATFQDLPNYFGSFRGFSECSIQALDLYSPPPTDERGAHGRDAFCPNRRTLLQAMSNGGRVGFDAPYISKGCHYRWYSAAEICMILERFDSLVFVGDSSLQTIYNGLSIILRQDLANGALQTWAMSSGDRIDCRCDHQFIKSDCAQHFVTASEQVSQNLQGRNDESGNSYFCDRTPHVFLSIGSGKPAHNTINQFNQAVPKAPKSKYKPIPIVHSLAPTSGSHKDASASLLEFVKLADQSERKTPMLWIGPTAAGHVEIKGRKTNQEIWDFDEAMAKTARSEDIEVLKMWNMTVQATSWDGVRFGERVALVQAMMVINWLSRLESS